MLIHKSKSLFISAAAAVVISCFAFLAVAQDAPPGARVRRPVPTSTPQPTPTPQTIQRRGGRVTDQVKQGGTAQFSQGIFGTIRWKKELGLPSTDGGVTPNKALNCTAFRVTATTQEGTPGTFGAPNAVGYWTVQNEPTEENGYYICRYSIVSQNPPIPHDRQIVVSSFLGPFASAELNHALTNNPWFGATAPPPPPGYMRTVVGSRAVTLTDSAPHVTVDFEMVYRPVPAAPR